MSCNRKLVEDLKMLETEGIDVEEPTKRVVKAGLQFIVGDNLGAHNLAEMNQVFSSGNICRWCKANYNDVCRKSLCYSECQDDFKPDDWTVDQYDAYANKAEEEGRGVATFGVRGHCVFNQLKSFHCVLQMPPCLGHDWYEGCFSQDLQFYLDILINKEKLLTQDEFNRRIKNVLLSGRDSKNRPREFKTRKKGAKYEGSAGSLRILSRVLTILLSDVLDSSQVGSLIMKLVEVGELITAPRLSVDEIDNIMHFTIVEYLDMRVEAIDDFGMDTVKPKHHFVSHYHKLYKYHGPLIHLWAMRMESKHQYFKNCIRTSKNFINPTKTCATRHQRAQITYGFNGLFPRKFDVPPNAALARDIVAVTVDPFLKMFVSSLSEEALIPTTINIYGTKYDAGMIVVIEKKDFGEVLVGVLKAFAFLRKEALFGCTVFEAKQSQHGYYVTTKKVKDIVVVNQSNLADPHPLQRIGSADTFSFALHHYVSEAI